MLNIFPKSKETMLKRLMRKKKVGVTKITVGDRVIVEAVV
jgi:hypothetical protein